jgi:hypothetical protein
MPDNRRGCFSTVSPHEARRVLNRLAAAGIKADLVLPAGNIDFVVLVEPGYEERARELFTVPSQRIGTYNHEVTLGAADRAKLCLVNRLLHELTDLHAHVCSCELCEARWRTDVQEQPECWTIPDVELEQ